MRQFGDLCVNAGQDAIHRLQNNHFAAQSVPYAAQFKADVTSPNHHQTAGHVGKRKCGRAVADSITVFLDRTKLGWPTARAHKRAFGFNQHRFITLNLNRVDVLKSSPTLVGCYATLLEKHVDAACESIDNLVLPCHQFVQLQFDAADLDTVISHSPLGFFVKVAGFEQGFAGNASHTQAGTTEPSVLVNARGVNSELCCSYGRDIARRTTAEDNQIMLHGFHRFSLNKVRLFQGNQGTLATRHLTLDLEDGG